jgi:hypothetical protein
MDEHLVFVAAQCGVQLVARVPVEEFLVHLVVVRVVRVLREVLGTSSRPVRARWSTGS